MSDDDSSRSTRTAESTPRGERTTENGPSRANPNRTDGDDPPTIDEGRYLYCVVLVDDRSSRASGDAIDLETTGVEGEAVSVVVVDGIGAVVHECDEIYDSADLTRIRRWLVRHQTVVDDAGETFGTPLPFQFDTILRGGDDAVREWLRRELNTLREVLESLAGHWEYRIEVVRTDPVADETLEASDDRLSALRDQIDSSSEGTRFLLEKQYDRRAAEVRANRRAATTDSLRERLTAHAREVHELERSPSTTVDLEGTDSSASSITERGTNAADSASDSDPDPDEPDSTDDSERETICRLTVLAHEDAESEIGSVLDDVAAKPGLEVRFTGPWPPYTFAPELGGSDGESHTNQDVDTRR